MDFFDPIVPFLAPFSVPDKPFDLTNQLQISASIHPNELIFQSTKSNPLTTPLPSSLFHPNLPTPPLQTSGSVRSIPNPSPEVIFNNGSVTSVLSHGPQKSSESGGFSRNFINALMGPQSVSQMDLPTPAIKGNLPSIKLASHVEERGLMYCKFALVGRLDLNIMNTDKVREIAKKVWNPTGDCKTIPLGRGYLMFRFESQADFDKVFNVSSWSFGSQTLRLHKWSPSFDPESMSNSHANVWVKFPKLKQQFWDKEALFSMANAIGKPISLDKITRDRSFGYFASVMVEVDMSKHLPDKIIVELNSGVDFIQEVQYSGMPKFCNFCKMVGHISEECRKLQALKDGILCSHCSMSGHKIEDCRRLKEKDVEPVNNKRNRRRGNRGKEVLHFDENSVPTTAIVSTPRGGDDTLGYSVGAGCFRSEVDNDLARTGAGAANGAASALVASFPPRPPSYVSPSFTTIGVANHPSRSAEILGSASAAPIISSAATDPLPSTHGRPPSLHGAADHLFGPAADSGMPDIGVDINACPPDAVDADGRKKAAGNGGTNATVGSEGNIETPGNGENPVSACADVNTEEDKVAEGGVFPKRVADMSRSADTAHELPFGFYIGVGSGNCVSGELLTFNDLNHAAPCPHALVDSSGVASCDGGLVNSTNVSPYVGGSANLNIGTPSDGSIAHPNNVVGVLVDTDDGVMDKISGPFEAPGGASAPSIVSRVAGVASSSGLCDNNTAAGVDKLAPVPGDGRGTVDRATVAGQGVVGRANDKFREHELLHTINGTTNSINFGLISEDNCLKSTHIDPGFRVSDVRYVYGVRQSTDPDSTFVDFQHINQLSTPHQAIQSSTVSSAAAGSSAGCGRSWKVNSKLFRDKKKKTSSTRLDKELRDICLSNRWEDLAEMEDSDDYFDYSDDQVEPIVETKKKPTSSRVTTRKQARQQQHI